jgi:hypothetical protein
MFVFNAVKNRLVGRMYPVRRSYGRPKLKDVDRHFMPSQCTTRTVRLGRSVCSRQFGRASAPMMPRRVHTMRRAKLPYS